MITSLIQEEARQRAASRASSSSSPSSQLLSLQQFRQRRTDVVDNEKDHRFQDLSSFYRFEQQQQQQHEQTTMLTYHEGSIDFSQFHNSAHLQSHPSTLPSGQSQSQIRGTLTTMPPSKTTTASHSNSLQLLSSPNMAEAARSEWRQYGLDATQALEESRRGGGGGQGWLHVRVVAAETRTDWSRKDYTAYIIQVEGDVRGQQQQQRVTLEHRYSEFEKLHTLFQQEQVPLQTVFPSKSIMGRVGPWTPSASFAPQQHESLIAYRLKQLDIWLVHAVELYNHARIVSPTAQTALLEFLLQPTPLPCHQVNRSSSSSSPFTTWWKQCNPLSFTLGSAIRQAARTVEKMCHFSTSSHLTEPLQQSDQSIPVDLLRAAKGILFLTVAKAGLVVSGRVGTGLVVKRIDDDDNKNSKKSQKPTGNGEGGNENSSRWSAPIAMGTLGMGWGALAGGDVTHYMVVLTTEKAVLDLVLNQEQQSVQLGAELGVAVGPVGRAVKGNVQTGDWALHPAYAYAHSQGLFVGMSLEGSILTVRKDVNCKFYGSADITTRQILAMPPCKAAQPLYQALDQALQVELHRHAFRPSQVLFPNQFGEEPPQPSVPLYLRQSHPADRGHEEFFYLNDSPGTTVMPTPLAGAAAARSRSGSSRTTATSSPNINVAPWSPGYI